MRTLSINISVFESRSEKYCHYCHIQLPRRTYSKSFTSSLLLKMWRRKYEIGDFRFGFVVVWILFAIVITSYILIQIYHLLHKTALVSREEILFRNICPQGEYWQEVSELEVSSLLRSVSIYHKNAWSLWLRERESVRTMLFLYLWCSTNTISYWQNVMRVSWV